MKTPYAIVIGLALIAAAIFFREPSIDPAYALSNSGADGFECNQTPEDDGYKLRPTGGTCFVLHGDSVTSVDFMFEGRRDEGKYSFKVATTTWR